MNVKRFTARNTREALRLVREALGDDAVVLSTKPSPGGVEVVAMPPESLGHLEAMSTFEATPAAVPRVDAGAVAASAEAASRAADLGASSAEQDAERLSMSTLSFQDYVRKRMLKRRQASLDSAHSATPTPAAAITPPIATPAATRLDVRLDDTDIFPPVEAPRAEAVAAPRYEAAGELEPLGESGLDTEPTRHDGGDLLAELRAVKGLIEERFGALAFMEKLQRHPAEARLAQKLLDCGFSPMLVRKMADGFDADAGDETAWAAQVLERNLRTALEGDAIEDRGGVFALIGPTGVGKTTTTAKIAAAFAARHGAGNLGLITLDAYRVGAHEQLRAYGRILGVPVHTAHDRASLEDLLDLLTAKKMVLIDTAGMAQRDARTRELLEMLAHRSVQRVLVVDAAAQGETIEDVLVAYRAA